MVIHPDCRHYHSDRPCRPHKLRQRICATCVEYDPVRTEVLIVKLDAIGDVLRTTSLLQPLKTVFPNSRITWLTKANAADLLLHNPRIDCVLPFDASALLVLQTKQFDLVINPDTSETACRLASLARARERRGFWLGEGDRICWSNAAAQSWYEMGLDDRRKQSNRRTYQSILLDLCGLPAGEHPIFWHVSGEEGAFARRFEETHGVPPRPALRVGLNTGAGGRWTWKKWTIAGFEGLIHRVLEASADTRVLLYGGPEEIDRNARLRQIDPLRVVDTGAGNTLRQFGALVDLCDVMVTGDTLGLHVATALGKHVVALFGPTSSAEIELYGRGVKIAPEGMECLCCYLNDCEVRPACMERIGVEEVARAVLAQPAFPLR